ncbi:MAG TPA: hypothetical protein VLA85_12165 [Verrucomicrobiae bacterium]|nr:hypothetical protein [Verrucomicrobiae bacterium]
MGVPLAESYGHRPWRLLVIAITACGWLAACSNEADRAKLIGKWVAVGKPSETLEFRDDGSFEYLSGVGIRTSLQIFWRMGSGNKVVLSMADGVNPRSCYYKFDGDHLTFDDGSGSSCIPAEPDDMPMEYQRAGK